MSQKSILNYFSPSTSSDRNKRTSNENSPGQRGGGDTARDDVTPVKRPKPASGGSKRGNKWINTIKDGDDDSNKRQKLSPVIQPTIAVPPAVVDIFDDDFNEDDHEPPKPSTSKEASTPKLEPRASTSTASSVTPKSFTTSRAIFSTPATQPKKKSSTPRLSSFAARDTDNFGDKENDGSCWPPKDPAFYFLLPSRIKDKEGRRPEHPDYDEKTLYVPQEFLQKRTEAQRQWWKIKSEMFDTVLAFKVGKFYELFNMDALIGIEHLNLLPMGKSYYHSGFPEVSFPKYADILRDRGFRVTRVEQTESVLAKERRLQAGNNSKAKVVNREVCQIISPGVSLLNDFDAESCNKHSNKSNYLMAICQKPLDTENRLPEFGVCFVDSAIAKVFISQFEDDHQCSRLRTLIAHHPPAELLVERGYKNLTPLAVSIAKNYLNLVPKQQLRSDTEFLSVSNTFKYIREGKYFEKDDGTTEYPDVLKKIMDPTTTNPLVLPEFELAFRSFGAIIWNLRRCLVDEDILTLKNFEQYVPSDVNAPLNLESQSFKLPKYMILDAVTLDNLNILGKNPKEKRGNLFGLLNNCMTLFGERKLRSMVHSPSCDIDIINDRLDAIEELEKWLRNDPKIFDFLRKIPDLEKILSKLHSESITRKRDHPDSRAQMFGDNDVRKVKSFLDLLNCLGNIGSATKKLSLNISRKVNSKLLKSYLNDIPDLESIISQFKKTFDVREAKNNGIIVPERGTDDDYDECCRKIDQIERMLEDVRLRQCQIFKCNIEFVDSGKRRYMLKIPENNFAKVNPGSEYSFEGAVKGFKRMSTKEIESLVTKLKEAEEAKDPVMAKIRRNLFARFCKYQPKLMEMVKCLALLDALLSLTKAKMNMEKYSPLCRPNLVLPSNNQKPFISINEGRNPILMQNVDCYIPNDVELSDKLIILTGPNMGGKSTLMRSVGLIVVLCQIGSFVPATSVTMTPVDRIFTRLGAADNIIEGESTFMVELNQTCTIVKHATQNSLVLLDELGRGTATHDGTAIAFSVVDKLASEIKCRTLFATHYHSLVEEFEGNSDIVSNHMSCLVEKNKDGSESINFLYKLEKGDCPKSYGFHAARLAGLPDKIVKLAEAKANESEQEFQITRKIRSLCGTSDVDEATKLIKQLKQLIEE